MNFSEKIVTHTPLVKLWTNTEGIIAKRERYLTSNDIQKILKKYPVEFVIADVGQKLNWINYNNCYEFWKSEVQKHIADDINHIDLNNFPEHYAYIASEWIGENQTPIIFLEKVH